MIVGVDVGNTAIKWTTDGDDDAVRYVRLTSPRAIEQVSDDIGRVCVDQPSVSVRISSVNRVASTSLVSRLQVNESARIIPHLVTRDDLSIEVAVDFPERVGIDRLVGAYGATQGKPLGDAGSVMVVDAGTTVTVDLIDSDGVFQGGAILPGLAIQMAALASGTDALPRIDWHSCECGDGSVVPGKNTDAAIRLGILSSVAGGIERLARLYDNPTNVVVTGGDAACVSAALSLPHQVEEQLVCRTLLRMPLKR